MKKKSLLLVVALLALSGLMAAMAYSKASVTAEAVLSITSTDKALLALIPGDSKTVGLKDQTAYLAKPGDGEISSVKEANILKFRPGYGNGENRGLQPKSVYTWFKLFTIKNNSADDIKVWAVLTDSLKDSNVKWEMWVERGPKDNVYLTKGEEGAIAIPADGEVQVNLRIKTGETILEKDFSGEIKFNAKAIGGILE